MYYSQIQSLRDISNDNFSNGQIRYQYNIHSTNSWIPSKSFFRIRAQLQTASNRTRGGGVGAGPVQLNDDIAPNMFFGDSLFQQIEFKMAGNGVEKLDNYVHQIAVLRKRMQSESLNKTIDSQIMSEPNINNRISKFTKGNGSSKTATQLIPLSPTYIHLGINAVGNALTYAKYTMANAGGLTTITFDGIINVIVIPNLQSLFKPGQSIYFLDATVGNNNAGNIWRSREILSVEPTILTVKTNDTDGVIIAGANNLTESSFYINTSTSSHKGQQLNKFEVCWAPGLDIFNKNLLPGGAYEIVLTPHNASQLQVNAVETFLPKSSSKLLNVLGQYYLQIVAMDLFICEQEVSTKPASLLINTIECQSQTINSTSSTQKNFTVNPETHSLTMALQDNRAGFQTNISTSKFKIQKALGGLYEKDIELKLLRYFINYNGRVLPNPIPDVNYTEGDEDFFTLQYYNTMLYLPSQYTYTEDYETWKERGPYYHFRWPKTNNKAEEVLITTQFQSSAFDGDQGLRPNLLLFEHQVKSFKLEYQGDMLKAVM